MPGFENNTHWNIIFSINQLIPLNFTLKVVLVLKKWIKYLSALNIDSECTQGENKDGM